MIKLPRTLLALALLICLSRCEPNEPSATQFDLEFLILDGTTGLPLQGAQIQVLEGGIAVSTQSDGIGGFNEGDLHGAAVVSIVDSTTYAFSIRHPNFQVRELNASLGKTTVQLMPDSSGRYIYYRPVQLDDGLKVGNLMDAGLDTAKMQRLMEKIAKPTYRGLHSILIYKDGQLVLEEYYFGNNDTIDFEGGVIRDKSPAPIWWSRKEKHYVASVNKALTSTLTGIALDSKGLGTNALLKDYLPAYASYFEDNQNKSSVNFHHALNMTLGFQWDEWGSNDLVQLWKSDDFASFMLSRNNNGPDKVWYYNSASPNVVLKCLENMVDEPIRDWADTHFYSKLGITDYKWQNQPDGYPEGAARMYLRPRDMLKIGVTYLQDGQWNGDQIIPEWWVAKCFNIEERPAAGDYSHCFWIRELKGLTYLSADGDGGNFINIFPDQNMVIVITQGNYLQWPMYVTQANEIMGNYIIPAIL